MIPPDHSHMIGRKFGRWTVLAYHGVAATKDRSHVYEVVCECGRKKLARGVKLRGGNTSQCRSCGAKQNGRKGLYSRKAGNLYMIRCGDYVKIGSSYDVQRRVRDMMTNTPHDFEILYHGSGDGWQEKFWHDLFQHRHYRGEWFYMPAGGCEV